MERPVFQPLGTAVERLDTPALVVDLSKLEQNFKRLGSVFRDSPCRVRSHVSPHRCPAIAHRQLACGDMHGGISVSRVGEAETFVEAGFTDILVASEIVTPAKINRLCLLALRASITVAVDNPKNVRDLSESAQAHGSTLHVLVDVDVGSGRCGVGPGQAAVDLANQVARSQGLQFSGLTGEYQPGVGESPDDLAAGTARAVGRILDARDVLEREGLEIGTVSVGGTLDYKTLEAMEGVTEVRTSPHPLMDYGSCRDGGDFTPAARVLTTVVSHPADDCAVVDAGHKASGRDLGLPVVDGVPGATVMRLSAEHGLLNLEGEAQGLLDLGSKVWLVPWDVESCVNQYDYFHAIREGRLEAVWEIAARGRWD